jgi:hypothetical protein
MLPVKKKALQVRVGELQSLHIRPLAGIATPEVIFAELFVWGQLAYCYQCDSCSKNFADRH